MKMKEKYIIYRNSGGINYDLMTLEARKGRVYRVCNGMKPFGKDKRCT